MHYHHSFSVLLEYAIRKVQENQVGLKLRGTHQLLAYDDDVNLLGDNINDSKEVGLEINAEKIKRVLLSVTRNQADVMA
jgi:hypothetical protein